MLAPALTRSRQAAFWLGVMLVPAGFLMHGTWSNIPRQPALEYIAVGTLALFLSLVVSSLTRVASATICVLLFASLFAFHAGPLSVIAAVLLSLAALGVGSLFVPATQTGRIPLACVIGLATLSAVVGWLVIFPIHNRLNYLLLLVAAIYFRRKEITAMLRHAHGEWNASIAEAPRSALAAAACIGLASAACWLPTFQFDDLAYHLNLPWQLQSLGYYRLDAASLVWSLAPWSGDVIHAITQVLAGTESRGATNAIWLLASAALLWRLCADIGLEPPLRWLAIIIFASQPLTSFGMTTMQAEAPATSALLALALVLHGAPANPDARRLVMIAILAGLLLGLKSSLALFLVPMLIWLAWKWKGKVPWRGLPAAVAMGLFAGASSYVYALYISGNPILPLFNEFFRSPYFAPVNFQGAPWNTGFSLSIFWGFVFDTSHYLESKEGAAGFTYLGLSGAIAVALATKATRPLALVGLACLLLPTSQIQYLRYAFPAISLLIPIMVHGSNRAVGAKLTMIVGLCLSTLNVAYIANSNWALSNGAMRLFVTEGKDALLERWAPERLVLNDLRVRSNGEFLVLFPKPGSIFGAELGGRALLTNWYDKQLGSLRPISESDLSGTTWRRVFALTGVTHVLVRKHELSPALRAALSDNGAELQDARGPVELWKLSGSGHDEFMERRNLSRRLLRR